jgi:hypothetical protein
MTNINSGWNKAILLSFLIFFGLMLFFLIMLLRAGTEVTPSNYYDEGVKYQESINEQKKALEFGPFMGFSSSQKAFYLGFKHIKPDSGTLRLIWPPNPTMNVEYGFKINKVSDSVFIPKTGKPDGFWNVEMVFWSNGNRQTIKSRVWAR